MDINNNLSAQQSMRYLSQSTARLGKSLARLSSGSKIVSPEDDAGGLAVSSKLNSQILRNQAASANLGNAVSMTQTQDGFLQNVQKAIDRMGELSVLAQDVTKTDQDRANYDTEFQQLKKAVGDIFGQKFNGIDLFGGGSTINTTRSVPGIGEQNSVIDTGGSTGTIDINYDFFGDPDQITVYYPPRSDGGTKIGDTGNTSGSGTLSISFGQGASTKIEIVVDEGDPASSSAWSYTANVSAVDTPQQLVTTDGTGGRFAMPSVTPFQLSGSVATISGARQAANSMKDAIQTLAQRRAAVGANLTRLQSHMDELQTLDENLSAAKSRITDVDVAAESAEFAKSNILTQTGTAMLAQANAAPSMALRLLGG